jgi:alkanesulfonate monooxygenase SsuD/methylene tetrahydromethanopterin reductase-like flavin-dependent oxidoreductase (luciferase family)
MCSAHPTARPPSSPGETATLQTLSDGRFELGIGGGRPGGESDAVAVADGYGTPAERVRRVASTIAAARELPVPPRILVAASRSRMLELAAAEADIVTLGLPPSTPSAELFRTAATLRARAGDRPIELLSSIAAELLRRREDGGFSYVAVNAMFMDAFEPVMSRLRPPVPVRP